MCLQKKRGNRLLTWRLRYLLVYLSCMMDDGYATEHLHSHKYEYTIWLWYGGTQICFQNAHLLPAAQRVRTGIISFSLEGRSRQFHSCFPQKCTNLFSKRINRRNERKNEWWIHFWDGYFSIKLIQFIDVSIFWLFLEFSMNTH